MLNLAAWGVVNATLGEPLAAAHLCGITQTIDRAELSALLASLQWADGTELGLCLWSDSLSTVHTMEYVLKHGAVPDGIENADLWTEVHQLLQDRAGLATDVRWIPSHLSHDAGEDPFEDWVIRWNDAADRLAVYTNGARPLDLRRCYSAAKGTLDGWVQRLRQLRQFYFQVKLLIWKFRARKMQQYQWMCIRLMKRMTYFGYHGRITFRSHGKCSAFTEITKSLVLFWFPSLTGYVWLSTWMAE